MKEMDLDGESGDNGEWRRTDCRRRERNVTQRMVKDESMERLPPLRRFFNLPCAVTMSGLFFGLASAVLSVSGQFRLAMVALIAAGLSDLFDGFVARLLDLSDEEKRFGEQLDSLVDACSFGMAPGLFLVCRGFRSAPELALVGFYLAAVVWRLAYFNAFAMEMTHRDDTYRGLPVTFAALFFPLGYLIDLVRPDWVEPTLAILAFGAACLMLSPLPVKKPRGKWYAVFAASAVIVTILFLTARSGSGQG